MCMVLAARQGMPQPQQQLLARELAEQLAACGSAGDAAVLLVQYLGDVDGGVAALVAAKEWREALRVAYAAGRADLADTLVVPAAAQVRGTLSLTHAAASIAHAHTHQMRARPGRADMRGMVMHARRHRCMQAVTAPRSCAAAAVHAAARRRLPRCWRKLGSRSAAWSSTVLGWQRCARAAWPWRRRWRPQRRKLTQQQALLTMTWPPSARAC